MNYITAKLLLFTGFVVSMMLMSVNHKKRRKKIVFFGDSITEQGAGYGGYISMLQHLLLEAGIDDEYELKGAGVSGDKVYDLYLRMDEDVLSKGVDIVVVFEGINDVGHEFVAAAGTDIKQFEASYIAIIDKLLSAGIKVVLCTPGVRGENIAFSSKVDAEINLYSDVIRRLALQYELQLVDIRKAFMDYIVINNIEDKEQGILTLDKVHLNNKGNQLVAEEIWKVLKHIK